MTTATTTTVSTEIKAALKSALHGVTESTVMACLDFSGHAAASKEARTEIIRQENRLRSSLHEVIRRAASLLAELDDPEHAANVASRIVQGVGASGPVGSEWERAVAAAAALETVFCFAIMDKVES